MNVLIFLSLFMIIKDLEFYLRQGKIRNSTVNYHAQIYSYVELLL